MSASRTGMGLARKGQEMTEVMQDGTYTATPAQGGVQGGAQAVQFQRKFLARDKYDNEMNTKMQLMDDNGMTPFGQVYYDDKVGRWLEKKAAVAETANFDAYFNKEFNKNDLASRQFAQQINPDFYSTREQEMKRRADVVLKLKGIQLRGPQSKDDLYMQWLIDSGRVQLPADWDRIGAGFSGSEGQLKTQQESTYPQGLIRFPLFLTNRQRAERVEANTGRGLWGSATAAGNTFSSGQPNAGTGLFSTVDNTPLAKGTGTNNTLAKGFTSYLNDQF